MIDLPANWQEQIQNIDWSKVKEAVKDYGPALRVIQQTWSQETLLEISQGKLFVPDDVINEALAKRIPAEGKVKAVTIRSHANGRMDIATDTTAKVGRIELSGEIKEFVHEGDRSYMVYRVRERNLPSQGLMSWIFSRISLSMAERMFGHIEISDDLPLEIHGNTVKIDYSKVLADSDFGQTEYQGHRLIDMIEIKDACPKEGGIEFQTKLNIPDDVKDALVRLVKGKAAE
ncbi:hypothetical protein SAMN02910356_00853 [Selenomonas sp. GACV-9]|uniref:hypothetical protein n=1 Tax=Selenomonas sp. GACV-9 TaxID=3158782 RepID=UPI0008E78306|nr:hypothetical protein SAMN02910356_00853 [Selenomonas ruminantium]